MHRECDRARRILTINNLCVSMLIWQSYTDINMFISLIWSLLKLSRELQNTALTTEWWWLWEPLGFFVYSVLLSQFFVYNDPLFYLVSQKEKKYKNYKYRNWTTHKKTKLTKNNHFIQFAKLTCFPGWKANRIWMNEWMNVYLYTAHITYYLMVVNNSIEWDRTSACDGMGEWMNE